MKFSERVDACSQTWYKISFKFTGAGFVSRADEIRAGLE